MASCPKCGKAKITKARDGVRRCPRHGALSQRRTTVTIDKPKAKRGFAAMSPERRREIAQKGGAAVDPSKRSFSVNRDLATSAGRKGGESSSGGGRPRKEG